MNLTVCGNCSRHVVSSEKNCPFCGILLAAAPAADVDRKNWRTVRWGAVLAVAVTEACAPVSLYGPGPITEPDGGPPDAGIVSSSSATQSGSSGGGRSSSATTASSTPAPNSSGPVPLYGPGPIPDAGASSSSSPASSGTASGPASSESAPIALYGPGPIPDAGA